MNCCTPLDFLVQHVQKTQNAYYPGIQNIVNWTFFFFSLFRFTSSPCLIESCLHSMRSLLVHAGLASGFVRRRRLRLLLLRRWSCRLCRMLGWCVSFGLDVTGREKERWETYLGRRRRRGGRILVLLAFWSGWWYVLGVVGSLCRLD